jgi:hypothetical protein
MPSVTSVGFAARAIVLTVIVGGFVTHAQTEDPLVERGDNTATLQAQAIMGQMKPIVVPLSPCFPERPIAFDDLWPATGLWAGEFRVAEAGAGGPWRLKVEAVDGQDTWETPLPTGAAEPFRTHVMRGNAFRVSLLGPATPGAKCPRVHLERQLEEQIAAEARGVVGEDGRWDAMSPALDAETDAAAIRGWSASIAHLRVLTSTHYLIPCTGFFITPRVMVTAAHCIPSSREAATSTVFLEGRDIPGSEFQLLMAQGDDLDFTLLWLKSAPTGANLRVGTANDPRLVLWQQPLLNKKLVSVKECGLRDPADTGGRRVPPVCDTEPGASGSPVQSRATGTVIGLHTIGCNPAQNRTKDCVNYAINFEEIRKRVLEKERPLRARNAEAAAEVIAALGP